MCKVLKCKEKQLGIAVLPITKSTVTDFTPEESSAVLKRTIARQLESEGWNEVREGLQLRQDFLSAVPGKVTECMAVTYDVHPGVGGDNILTVSPGKKVQRCRSDESQEMMRMPCQLDRSFCLV